MGSSSSKDFDLSSYIGKVFRTTEDCHLYEFHTTSPRIELWLCDQKPDADEYFTEKIVVPKGTKLQVLGQERSNCLRQGAATFWYLKAELHLEKHSAKKAKNIGTRTGLKDVAIERILSILKPWQE